MGVHLCWDLIEKEEFQAVMLGGEDDILGELCKTVTLLRHLHWEEYKHSASVQSLLITPETG